MSKGKPQKESKFLHSGDLYRVSRTHHCNKTKKKEKRKKTTHHTQKKTNCIAEWAGEDLVTVVSKRLRFCEIFFLIVEL